MTPHLVKLWVSYVYQEVFYYALVALFFYYAFGTPKLINWWHLVKFWQNLMNLSQKLMNIYEILSKSGQKRDFRAKKRRLRLFWAKSKHSFDDFLLFFPKFLKICKILKIFHFFWKLCFSFVSKSIFIMNLI